MKRSGDSFQRKRNKGRNEKNKEEKGRKTCKRKRVRNEKAKGCDELDKALIQKPRKV